MSLADELLTDLEEANDDEVSLIAAVKQQDETQVTEEDAAMDTGGRTTYDCIANVAKLHDSVKFKEAMANVKTANAKPRETVVAGS